MNVGTTFAVTHAAATFEKFSDLLNLRNIIYMMLTAVKKNYTVELSAM